MRLRDAGEREAVACVGEIACKGIESERHSTQWEHGPQAQARSEDGLKCSPEMISSSLQGIRTETAAGGCEEAEASVKFVY